MSYPFDDACADAFGSFGGPRGNVACSSSAEGQRPRALTVSQAMRLAKASLEQLTVSLVGEVSEVSDKPGYKAVYFTVKDADASLPCMMWNNRYRATGVRLAVGQLVELTGRFTLYAAKGRMNFDVVSLSLAGEGLLRQRVDQLARKLRDEGFMEPSRKRPLPESPELIGLVTSPRGDAIHDVLRTLRRRYPLANVVVAGVPVEGANAARGMVEALRCIAGSGAQVALLVRGGGSFEDLMPFNDEGLARAISAMPIPVVTGIGHEPDTTIADMVADRRASTPTAAAEAVVPDQSALRQEVRRIRQRLTDMVSNQLRREAQLISMVHSRPLFADPQGLYSQEAMALDALSERLARSAAAIMRQERFALSSAAARLHDLSPLAVIARGYAIARLEGGETVSSVARVSEGDCLTVCVADGEIDCRVESARVVETGIEPLKERS